MTHLLDTTALLAFILGETGSEKVRALIEDDRCRLAVSVLTKVEFRSRLKSIGRETVFEEEWALHLPLFDAVLDVDERAADLSITLRRACSDRLPMVDALIAATATAHRLTLVHRDAHFRAIPAELVPQVDLLEPANP